MIRECNKVISNIWSKWDIKLYQFPVNYFWFYNIENIVTYFKFSSRIHFHMCIHIHINHDNIHCEGEFVFIPFFLSNNLIYFLSLIIFHSLGNSAKGNFIFISTFSNVHCHCSLYFFLLETDTALRGKITKSKYKINFACLAH